MNKIKKVLKILNEKKIKNKIKNLKVSKIMRNEFKTSHAQQKRITYQIIYNLIAMESSANTTVRAPFISCSAFLNRDREFKCTPAPLCFINNLL